MRMRPGRGGRDGGAAAVEFALVLPVLMLLIMGIINYGLWFNDSLQLRQGIREAARQAVVLVPFSGTGCVGTTGMTNVECGTKSQTVTTGGVASVHILTPDGWVRGHQVVVCAWVKSTNLTGFVPLPAGGIIKSKTSMSIESVPTPAPSPTSYTADPPPPSETWESWCTS
jgi:TadE-like protein